MTPSPVTEELLSAWRSGDPDARDRLLSVLYDDLKLKAMAAMRPERPDHTLQATALAHDAYLRLIRQDRAQVRDRSHFLRLAAEAMRRILIDHARKKQADKHGGGRRRTTLDEGHAIEWQDPTELLALEEALNKLARTQPRQAQIVEMKFFGGLTLQEIADALDVSRDTVKLDWRFAKRWLESELAPDEQA